MLLRVFRGSDGEEEIIETTVVDEPDDSEETGADTATAAGATAASASASAAAAEVEGAQPGAPAPAPAPAPAAPAPKPKPKKTTKSVKRRVVNKKKAVKRSHWKLPLAVTVLSGVTLGLMNAFYWKKGFKPSPEAATAAAAASADGMTPNAAAIDARAMTDACCVLQGCTTSVPVANTGVVPEAAPTKRAGGGDEKIGSDEGKKQSTGESWIRPLPIPIGVLTDSYKASHFLMYPDAQRMVAYGEFREGFDKDKYDRRFIFFGIRYIIDNYVARQWTMQDVDLVAKFYSTHNAPFFSNYPFPKELFQKFVKENNGYFPVRIEALPEGTVANVHTPVYQIFAEGEYSRLITFLETLLTQVWYPTTVATLSRRTKDIIEDAFEKTVDKEWMVLLDSRLHDFGFRGTTCVEQSVLGGCAHLLNFTGSDTMSACYYAQFALNGGRPVATSIPATEHSVMTSWPSEKAAISNMIDKFDGKDKIFACVMDSYDYKNALEKVLPSVAAAHKAAGGLMVLRPDSGDPVECITMALEAGEKAFGSTVNSKGFKVLHGISAIQGDGININTVRAILEASTRLKYSAQNVAFGMGGGLLQKVNRDTMAFATKLNYIQQKDGTIREVMKKPKTDMTKASLPGILRVERSPNGLLYVYPREYDEKVDPSKNELKVVYDHGKPLGPIWDDFDTIRKRVSTQWRLCPRQYDPISEPLHQKMAAWVRSFEERYAKMMAEADK